MIIDLMYFHLYNFFYKDNNCKDTDNPPLRAAHVLAAGFVFWILFIVTSCNLFFLGIKEFLPFNIYLILYFIFFLPTYFFYYKKKRYIKIYELYKNLGAAKKTTGRVLTISFVLLPIFLIALFTILLTHK